MKKQRFELSKMPEGRAIAHRWVQDTLDLQKYWGMPIRHKPDRYLKYTIKGFDHAACTAQADEICGKIGWHGFTSYTQEYVERVKNYGGFSVSYNPNRKDVSIYQSSLGDVKWNLTDVFASTEGVRFYKWLESERMNGTFYDIVARDGMEVARKFALRHGFYIDPFLWQNASGVKKTPANNNYYDTWGFNKLIPEMQEGAMGDLVKAIKRPFVRSRCAYLRPTLVNSELDKEYLWHVDELVFVNFRLNIPLRTNSNYFLEDQALGRFDFDGGYGYSWNTEKMHRATWTTAEAVDRSALVIGTNPWFDFIEEEQAYVSNEFFGEKHPFDMLVDGDIIDIESVTLE